MPVTLAPALLYHALYRFPGYRREVVQQNLSLALPDMGDAERQQLTRQHYRHLATLLTQVLRSGTMDIADFSRAVELENAGLVRDASQDFARSVVFVLLHQGNWEWLLHGASHQLGITIDPVYQPLHNRAADRYLHSLRARFGAHPVDVAGLGDYLRRYRREPRAIALLADQAPTAAEASQQVPFLGVATAFKSGFVRVARMMDATLVFTACERTPDGRYRATFHTLGDATGAENRELTLVQHYAQLAQEAILKQPESWLWTHRRWK